MQSILVVGSAALDTIETGVAKAEDCVGGSALYFTAGASLFAPVSVVSIVGKDFPMEKLAFMRERNVNLSGLEISNGLTFRWGGRYDRDFTSRETLFTALNSFETFEPKIPESMRTPDFLFLGNILPELQELVLEQVQRPKFVLLDTIRLWIENKRDELLRVISKVDAIVLNDEEIRLVTDIANIPKAVKKLFTLGPKWVIVKRGEHGVTMYSADGDFCALPAIPIDEVADPTGAGDSFAGGFLGRLALESDLSSGALRRALVAGTVVASFTVQAFGLEKLISVTPNELTSREAILRNSVMIP